MSELVLQLHIKVGTMTCYVVVPCNVLCEYGLLQFSRFKIEDDLVI